jgi:hypothetical protein
VRQANKKDINKMKSYNHLFEQLISKENLELAIVNSSKDKTRRDIVQDALNNKEVYVKNLQEQLINQTYRIKEHKVYSIIDGKPRLIIKPDYIREQILHHAIIQVLKPIMLKSMYQYSCGSIPHRGAHYGKVYIEKFIKKNPTKIKYILKMDVYHFFQSIDINILKAKFKKLIHDDKMLYVINLVLDSNKALYKGKVIDMGLPIGFYTSQWFANFYLQELDHYIKEELQAIGYVRYVDDMIMFHPNKKKLHKTRLAIQEYINNLGLELKGNWQVSRFDYINKEGKRIGRPLDFVGFKFYRDKTVIRKKILYRIYKQVNSIKKNELTTHKACIILSYYGWMKHTDSTNLYTSKVRPVVPIKKCREYVSKAAKEKQNGYTMERCGEYSSAN